ncbi:DUF3558 domain-containing protein [Nocardia cyriacigeorgica]|uniref:DUF3558 domain-containing protein n=1 Tax=Nocardia cyriacigeorgica TaxID=135487 RepID=A0A5R8PKT7_9NOCA|nr:DUF3558 family protein [Nocardia cyriacigeorgica]TLG17866.1 DUF3558 domain-containing protein [Nocardia cyriacigeorgica]
MRSSVGVLMMTGLLVGLPALTGCGSSTSDIEADAPDLSFAAEPPQGYDPCHDVPQALIDAEQLHSREPVEGEASLAVSGVKDQPIKFRGCQWVRTNNSRVQITTTVLTVDIALWRHSLRDELPDANEFTIVGRRAITRRPDATLVEVACVANVDMKGGSLEIEVYDLTARTDPNPAGDATPRLNPGSTDVCVRARNLAEQIVPSLPTGT